MTPKTTKTENTLSSRPPIVVVLGHVDHGKSTLLDFLRKSNVVAGEAGGITQHVGAYIVEAGSENGPKPITFLDTPGHEAFRAIRSRGARVADIAILVVAADDGVKAQTIEALAAIREANIPFIVAINKIDKSDANPDRVKQELAEQNVFVEGYGGDVPVVAISAKTGVKIPDLLELILLVADLADLKADARTDSADGVIIEAHHDSKKGVVATLLVKNGTFSRGQYIVTGTDISPVRTAENFLGVQEKSFNPGVPVRIIGISEIPTVGSTWRSFSDKKSAESYAEEALTEEKAINTYEPTGDHSIRIPVIVKADTTGTLEALLYELAKAQKESVGITYVGTGVGAITETDIKRALSSTEKPLIIGFNIKIDKPARDLAEKNELKPELFNIIYKARDWLALEIEKRIPKSTEPTVIGTVRILKTFSQKRDHQIVGGEVLTGRAAKGKRFVILRRENKIGEGKFTGLQSQKVATNEVTEGKQFGADTESKLTLASGDILEVLE